MKRFGSAARGLLSSDAVAVSVLLRFTTFISHEFLAYFTVVIFKMTSTHLFRVEKRLHHFNKNVANSLLNVAIKHAEEMEVESSLKESSNTPLRGLHSSERSGLEAHSRR
jgi:hypothetical protein